MILKNKRQKVKEFFNYGFLLKNRRGAEKILAVYWFAVLIIISVGVFSIVFSFQSPYDVRGLEASVLAGQVADCLAPQGVLKPEIVEKLKLSEVATSTQIVESTETKISGLTGKVTAESIPNPSIETCEGGITGEACRKVIGNKILKIVRDMKPQLEIDYPDINLDETVSSQDVAANFECLVLQVAYQESALRHCAMPIKDKNPLYCDTKKLETYQSKDTYPSGHDLAGQSKSWGVLQIVGRLHGEKIPADFGASVEYAVREILLKRYGVKAKDYVCKPNVSIIYYSGWKSSLRWYNGWNTDCDKGDGNYVENVISQRKKIGGLFPIQCPSGKVELGLLEMCHLKFENNGDDESLQYYFRVDFVKDGKSFFAEEGDLRIKSLDINLQEVKESKVLSKFIERSFYAVDENNVGYQIKILSAVKKTKQNVK